MATIGNVQTMYLISSNQIGEEYETNISKGFTVNGGATYRQVDTASRALNALTTNTYVDTKLLTSISVNETLMEEG